MYKWTEAQLRHITDSHDHFPMFDSDGKLLSGIYGKPGVRSQKVDGSQQIGGDFIQMHPGSKFPLHTHSGDHILYIIKGNGFVHIDGKDIGVGEGHIIHIPAEYPHGVWVSKSATNSLIFVAVGHPHENIDSILRMKVVK